MGDMDHDYARGKLALLLRDLNQYNRGEFWRQMSRIAEGATGMDGAESLKAQLSALVDGCESKCDSLQSQLDEANTFISDIRGGKVKPFPDLEEKDIADRRIAKLEAELEAMRAQCERYRIVLNPRKWNWKMHDAWHNNIPDVAKAFETLRQQAKEEWE